MKKAIIFIYLFVCLTGILRAQQPYFKDTIVVVVDTTQQLVEIKKKKFSSGYPENHWQVNVKGHYYDIEYPQYKDSACIILSSNDLATIFPDFNDSLKIQIQKKYLCRFTLYSDKWLNEQTNLGVLYKKIGAGVISHYNFLIFKQDLEDKNKDTVTLYRVTVGFNEIQN